MSPLAVSKGPRDRIETLVDLPAGDTDRLLAAMDALRGRTAWGVQELMPHRAHADPGALIDQSLLTAVTVIDDIMRLTPVEQLRAAGSEQVLGRPPEDDDVFREWNRKSIRWQLGF